MGDVERDAGRLQLTSDWASPLTLVFIIACLIALVVAPWAVHKMQAPLEADLKQVAAPGRAYVTRLHLALAQQAVALHDYVESGDTVRLIEYENADERERLAYDGLAPVASRLGRPVEARLDSLRRLERRLDTAVAALIATVERGRRMELAPELESLLRTMMIAAAELDDAIDAASRDRRTRIARIEATQRRIETALGVLALVAVAATWMLGRRVREFAAVAEQQRLQAVALMHSKARLMRGMSHDLKNPLNLIGGHAQLIEDGIRGPVTPEQRDSLQRIQRATRSLLAMIEDLLQLARAETGQLDIALREVDVPALLRELFDEERPLAATAGLSFGLAIGEEVGTIVTDPARVRQVLANLVSNAIKYTPRGGRVELRAAHADDTLQVAVADTGPGIPPEKREEIFAEFTRLTPGHAPGAGLGLAIARRIARLLGGDITLESEVGVGSRFIFALPLAPTSSLAPSSRREPLTPPAARAASAAPEER